VNNTGTKKGNITK